MKMTRETSSSPGFTKNSMYVMPRRGSSTRVAFTAFLRWGGVGRPRVTAHPRRGEEGRAWGEGCQVPRMSEMGSWGFQEGLSDLCPRLGSLEPPWLGEGGGPGYLY